MKVNSSDFILKKLILNSMILENFEYYYFCPLLREIGSYFGHTDVILTAHKLSQQAQNISYLKKKIEQTVQKKYFYIKKHNTIHCDTNLNVLNIRIENLSYEIILPEHEKNSSLEKYLLLVYIFLDKYCSEIIQPTKKIRFDLLNQSSCNENIFTCLIFLFLIYKIWKIEYWYISISKLAFDSKQLRIAQYFIQIARLESKMISMLINLLKQVFQTNILLRFKSSIEQKVMQKYHLIK
jgi:hypothetical protein